MEYICTTCCKDKKKDDGLLPAIQRYISKRITFVFNQSQQLQTPLIILSGKYGLIGSDDKIPWYDQKLTPEDVDALVPVLTQQLQEQAISSIIFYGRPRTTPGWEPYYDALEQACRQFDIPITYQLVNLE